MSPDGPAGPRDPAEHAERADKGDPADLGNALEALPGLARVAGHAAWHTTEWGVKTSARAWLRVGRAVTRPEEASALARDATRAAGVVGELARSVSSGVPVARALMTAGESLGGLVEAADSEADDAAGVGTTTPRTASLRDRGQELLERSRDVWNTEQGHPAFDRILDELAPDEARVLLLLLTSGPQPSVDVRTGGPIGLMSSQLIAPGLTMIGARAGCRYVDQVPAYLNNLFRLGLVWFSREPLRDPMPYQVVEAQPDVLEAMHSVKFAKVVRRSIHLTPFGEDFCRSCLVEEGTLDDAALPPHQPPPESDTAEPPSRA